MNSSHNKPYATYCVLIYLYQRIIFKIINANETISVLFRGNVEDEAISKYKLNYWGYVI